MEYKTHCVGNVCYVCIFLSRRVNTINLEKVVLWSNIVQIMVNFWRFQSKLTNIDVENYVKRRQIFIWHPKDYVNTVIDQTHNKNPKQVVLWLFIVHMVGILAFFNQNWRQMTSNMTSKVVKIKICLFWHEITQDIKYFH